MFGDKLLKQATITDTDTMRIHEFEKGGIKYKVAFTRAITHKRVFVLCEDKNIELETLYPGRYSCPMIRTPVAHVSQLLTPDTFSFLVVRGHPALICGLDEGVFACSRKWSPTASKDKLYVMSKKAWKLLRKTL